MKLVQRLRGENFDYEMNSLSNIDSTNATNKITTPIIASNINITPSIINSTNINIKQNKSTLSR